MLSKDEKLRYGQVLREQIREREEAKKNEARMKRGVLIQSPNANEVNEVRGRAGQQRTVPSSFDALNERGERGKEALTEKQQLQMAWEQQIYDPYGKPGGGAPAPRKYLSQPNQVRASPEQIMAYEYEQRQLPPKLVYQKAPALPQSSFQYLAQMQKHSDYEPTQPSFDTFIPHNAQGQFAGKQLQPHTMHQLNHPYQQPNPYPPPHSYAQSYAQQYPPHPNINQPPYVMHPTNQPRLLMQPTQIASLPNNNYSKIHPNNYPQMAQSIDNEDEERNKKIGVVRGLLKSQNQSDEERLMKYHLMLFRQRQKMEMQKHLQQQIKMAEERKREEKQRLRREQLEEERKGLEYIALQKQKIIDEENKKQLEKQKIIEDNLRNLELRRRLQEEAKIKNQAQKKKNNFPETQFVQSPKRGFKADSRMNKQKEESEVEDTIEGSEQTYSVTETDTQSESLNSEMKIKRMVNDRAYKKEKKSKLIEGKEQVSTGTTKKLHKFTNEIKRMRDQIEEQGLMFQQQIERIKWESDKTQFEKQRAEAQIKELRNQILYKNKQDQQKLFEALHKQQIKPPPLQSTVQFDDKPFSYPSQPHNNQPTLSFAKSLPRQINYKNNINYNDNRQKQEQNVVHRNDFTNKERVYSSQNVNEFEPGTLNADSLKIPFTSNNELTMSKLGNVARKHKQQIFSTRPTEDELDKFVASRKTKEQNVNEGQQYKKYNQKQEYGKYNEKQEYKKYNEGQEYEKHEYANKSASTNTVKQIEELLRMKNKQDVQHVRMGTAQQEYRPKFQNDWSMVNEVKEINLSNKKFVSNKYDSQQKSNNLVSYNLQQGIPYESNGLLTVNSNTDVDEINRRNDRRLANLRHLGVETINTNDDQIKLEALLRRYN